MQTHCPQCGTQFRVTKDQLQSADGYVRCGRCEEIFNVYEVAELISDEDKNQQPVIQDDLRDSSAGSSNEEVSQKETFDFFDETSDDLMEHVVPDELRESHTPYATLSTALWSLTIISLIASLLLQYTWFNRHEIINIPQIQTEVAKLCQSFDCSNISIRAPSKVELKTRNVYSHPHEKKVLMVNVTMKNTANFSQPYPVMNINFSDIRGNIVAARHFFPDEYLPQQHRPGTQSSPGRLLPDASTSITMKIRDPGKQAMTYEFNFL